MATKKPKPGCVPVDDITEGGLDWTMELPDEFVGGLLSVDYATVGVPLNLRVRLTKVGEDNIVAQGSIAGRLSAICCRCLSRSDVELKKSFRHVFIEGKDPAQDKAEEVISETDDLSATFFSGDYLDLLALAGDELALALPVNPVCRDDCRGLCPVCGSDRNVSPCGCETGDGDPRWDVLKSLKLDPKN